MSIVLNNNGLKRDMTSEKRHFKNKRPHWTHPYIANLNKLSKSLFYTDAHKFPSELIIPTQRTNLMCELGGAESSTGLAIFPLSPDMKFLPGRLFPNTEPNGITSVHDVWVGCKVVISYMYAGKMMITIWNIDKINTTEKNKPGELECSLFDSIKDELYSKAQLDFVEKYPAIHVAHNKAIHNNCTKPYAFEHFSTNSFEKADLLKKVILVDKTNVSLKSETDTVYDLASFSSLYTQLVNRAIALYKDGFYVNLVSCTKLKDDGLYETGFKLMLSKEAVDGIYTPDNVYYSFTHNGDIAENLISYRDPYVHILLGAITRNDFDKTIEASGSNVVLQVSLLTNCKNAFHNKVAKDPVLNERFKNKSNRRSYIKSPKSKHKEQPYVSSVQTETHKVKATTTAVAEQPTQEQPSDLNSILGIVSANEIPTDTIENTSDVVEVATGYNL